MERENLHKHLHRLTKKERAVLLSLVRGKPEWKQCHLGMLAFLPRAEVCVWIAHLEVIDTGITPQRLLKQIYAKLSLGGPTGDIVSLKDESVFRRFGKHPERGVVIPGMPTSHRRRERRPFERKKDAYDINMQIVSLKRIGPNRWVLHAREGVRNQALAWLTDNMR